MFYIYILYNLKDKKFYTGRTKDLCKRLERHNKGLVRSTKHRRPLQLAHCETFAMAKGAFLREKELKSLSAGKFKRELRERLNL